MGDRGGGTSALLALFPQLTSDDKKPQVNFTIPPPQRRSLRVNVVPLPGQPAPGRAHHGAGCLGEGVVVAAAADRGRGRLGAGQRLEAESQRFGNGGVAARGRARLVHHGGPLTPPKHGARERK